MFVVKYISLFVILGNCFCEVGFGGSDCFFDILLLLFIWELMLIGICDKFLY